MKSQLGGIRRKFMQNQLITTSQNVNSSTPTGLTKEQEDNVIEWLTLF